MSFFAKLKIGAIALDAARWAADVAHHIDPAAALRVAFKVLEIQSSHANVPGADRLLVLLAWARQEFQLSDNVTVLIGYVNSIVALLKAVQVFRK